MTPEEARRRLRAKAHRDADRQTQRFAEAVGTQRVIATVAAITVGGASDGNDLLSVSWRGGTVLAAGWNLGEAFAVGQTVVCDLIDGSLLVDYPIGGQP